jgi:TPR repeat protein
MCLPARRETNSGTAAGLAGRLITSLISLWLFVIPATQATAKPADSEFRNGLSAYNSGNYQKAIDIWLPLAQHEDAPSQAGLGFIYHRGLGVPVDHDKAAFWLRKAAEHGQPEGQMLLGSLYFYGQGVPKSYVQAFAWCDLAQDNGNSDAGMCRDSALQYLTSKADLELAFRASADLHHRLSGH